MSRFFAPPTLLPLAAPLACGARRAAAEQPASQARDGPKGAPSPDGTRAPWGTCGVCRPAWTPPRRALGPPALSPSSGASMAETGLSKAHELKVIVVGKTGSGKSAMANTILGEKKFKSDVSLKALTTECEKGEGSFRGRKISVVDTPGFFDPGRDNKAIARSIKASVPGLSGGFHAVLLVLKLDRFTEEEKKAIDEIHQILQVRAKDYTILVFTRKEELGTKTLGSVLADGPEDLKKVVNSCGQRYLAFNNRATGAEREAQVAELIQMIDKMGEIHKNDPLYTPDMFQEDSEKTKCCNIL